jgi:hypothetical protein
MQRIFAVVVVVVDLVVLLLLFLLLLLLLLLLLILLLLLLLLLLLRRRRRLFFAQNEAMSLSYRSHNGERPSEGAGIAARFADMPAGVYAEARQCELGCTGDYWWG